MRILITGHTGFVGAWLGTFLHKMGHELYGFSLQPRDTSLFASNPKFSDMFKENYFGRIQQKTDFIEYVNRIQPEIIFHLAAQPIVKNAKEDQWNTYETNVMGTLSVMQCAEKIESVGTLILVTTDKVYKQKSQRISYTEEDELFSNEPYGASKVSAEQLIQAYYSNKDQPRFGYAIARAGNIVGAGDDGEARLLPYILNNANSGKEITLRNPNATRPWTYILDVVNGYWKLAEIKKGQKGYLGAWNFGSDPSGRLTVRETTNLILREFNQDNLSIIHTPETFYEQEFLELDSSKAKQELKWKPKFSAKEAIEITARKYLRFSETDTYSAVSECINEYKIPREND
jgi:CDP-glucose 4,6-dehydratase